MQSTAAGASGLQRPKRAVGVQDTGTGGESIRIPDEGFSHISMFKVPQSLT